MKLSAQNQKVVKFVFRVAKKISEQLIFLFFGLLLRNEKIYCDGSKGEIIVTHGEQKWVAGIFDRVFLARSQVMAAKCDLLAKIRAVT